MDDQQTVNQLAGSRRIVIIGTSGSGKTTLAGQIATRLGMPHIELDALHWEPNWQEAPVEVFRARVETSLSGTEWVVDGNYSKVRDLTWGRADTLIWLNYRFELVMSRIVRRTVSRAVMRKELWNGNRERWQNIFRPNRDENIILWSLTTHHKREREYPVLLAQPEYARLKILRLKSPREVADLLARLEPKA